MKITAIASLFLMGFALIRTTFAMEATAVGSANDDGANVAKESGGVCDGADGPTMNAAFDTVIAEFGDDMGQLDEVLPFLTWCGGRYCSMADVSDCVDAKREERQEERQEVNNKLAPFVEMATVPLQLESSKFLNAQETFEMALADILDEYKKTEDRMTVTTQLMNLVKATKRELRDLFDAVHTDAVDKGMEAWKSAQDAIDELHNMHYEGSLIWDQGGDSSSQLLDLLLQAEARVEELYQAAWKQIHGDVQDGVVEDEPMHAIADGSSEPDGDDIVVANIDDMDPAVAIANDATMSQVVRPLVTAFFSKKSKLEQDDQMDVHAKGAALNRLRDDYHETIHFWQVCGTKHSSLTDVTLCLQAKLEAHRDQDQAIKMFDQSLEELKTALSMFPPQLESKIQNTLEKFETGLANIVQQRTVVAATRIMDHWNATNNEIQELCNAFTVDAFLATMDAFDGAKDAKLYYMRFEDSPFEKQFLEMRRDLRSQRKEAIAHVDEEFKAAWAQIFSDFEGGETESTEPADA